jgi:hypothetical protein
MTVAIEILKRIWPAKKHESKQDEKSLFLNINYESWKH